MFTSTVLKHDRIVKSDSGRCPCDKGAPPHRRIAGVDYLVTLPHGVVALATDAAQAEFAALPPVSKDGITVDLVVGEPPDLSFCPVLVSDGPGWCIRGRGAQRILCFGAPAAAPFGGLIACWQEDASRATVYCGSEYLRARPDGVELGFTAGYPVDQMLLMYHLARRRGLLVHAAGLAAAGRAIVFPGVSGAGKSTLARELQASGWPDLLSDDRIIVRRLNGGWHAFGTPWPGDAGIAVNAGAPLTALLFPARGEATRIRELSIQDALGCLLPAASILWYEPELLTSQLETCERLLADVPAFELAWSPETGIVNDVREFLRQL